MSRILLVMAGGALGSVLRYLVALWMVQRFGATFPWGTLTVNAIGSLMIGFIATLADEAGSIGPSPRLLLVVGLLGGFTTFSAFSLETMRLLQDNQTGRAVFNILANVAIACSAAAIGIAAARILSR
jgi:CrcB protein